MMSTEKHTPGPWEHRVRHEDTYNDSGRITAIARYVQVARTPGTTATVIADVRERSEDEITKANARLIAAAPDLAEACPDKTGHFTFHEYAGANLRAVATLVGPA